MNFFNKSAGNVISVRNLFQNMIESISDNEFGLPNESISQIFVYEKTLGTPSVNAFTHVMHLKDEPRFKVLVKTARDAAANSLVREFEVQRHLNALHDRTPNFPVALGLFNCFSRMTPSNNLISNVCSNWPAGHENTTMVLMEYVPGAIDLYDFAQTATPEQMYSIFKQIYYTLRIAQHFQRFTHYDLHFGNILVRRIPRTTLSYTLENNSKQSFESDVLITIIDFGMSYLATISPDLQRLVSKYDPKYNIDMSRFNPTFDLIKVLQQTVPTSPALSVAIDGLIKMMEQNPNRFPLAILP